MKTNKIFGFCYLFSGIVFLMLAHPVSAQRLRLVLGTYECTTNAQCDSDTEYCDIDEHKCISLSNCPVCEVCEECPICPTLECPDGFKNINNRCVECSQHNDCPADKPFCDPNSFSCFSCANISTDKPMWNGTSCVACPTNTPMWNGSSCVACPSMVPVWNEELRVCVPCSSINITKPYWNGSQCTACPSSKPVWNTSKNQCVSCYQSNASKPNWNGSQCTACPSSKPVWNTSKNQCVSCYQSNASKPYWNGSQCTACPSSKPVWNTSKNQCVTCYAIDTSKPVWNSSKGVCEACPLGQIWNTNQNKCIETNACSSNSQCDTRIEYCKITSWTTHCIVGSSGLSGTCTDKGSLGSGYNVRMLDGTVKVYHSPQYMNWWSAKYWCQAHGKKLIDVSGTRLGCYLPWTTTRMSINRGSGNNLNCCNYNDCSMNNRGQGMQDMLNWFNYSYYWGWAATDNDDCEAYRLRFNNGWLDLGWRSDELYAVCE